MNDAHWDIKLQEQLSERIYKNRFVDAPDNCLHNQINFSTEVKPFLKKSEYFS